MMRAGREGVMSWLHNLLSSMIAFLMAVVLAHFGAHGQSAAPATSGDSRPVRGAADAHRAAPPSDASDAPESLSSRLFP
jgi:hypothetical protein